MAEGGRGLGAALLAAGTAILGGVLLLSGSLIAVTAGAQGSISPIGILAATSGPFLIVAGVGRFEGWTWSAGTVGLILASLAAILKGGVFILSGIVTLGMVAYGVVTRAGWLARGRR